MNITDADVFTLLKALVNRAGELRKDVLEENVLGEIPPTSLLLFQQFSELIQSCRALELGFTVYRRTRYLKALEAFKGYYLKSDYWSTYDPNDDPDGECVEDEIIDLGVEYARTEKRYRELQGLYRSRLETTKAIIEKYKQEKLVPVEPAWSLNNFKGEF